MGDTERKEGDLLVGFEECVFRIGLDVVTWDVRLEVLAS